MCVCVCVCVMVSHSPASLSVEFKVKRSLAHYPLYWSRGYADAVKKKGKSCVRDTRRHHDDKRSKQHDQ